MGKWKNRIRKNRLKLADADEMLNDFRYIPVSSMWGTNPVNNLFGNAELLTIIGLTVLLTKLLSKNFTWPTTSNKLLFIDEVFTRSAQALEFETVSSDTRILISHIFSKTDIDYFNGNIGIQLNTGKSINGISEFVEQLKVVRKNLERYQVSGDQRGQGS
ncbi:hypothetical protein MKQ70_22225 [Chitinophaga sedimenti]|uniref:hypothetical protein n=1 Tax=Chitinophaga sedimenti TaxID=2033606 RepID=UPI00200310A4|nr:hypothetical protein [Chitinophaga sedimenti]MCK7557571.1 hypothetical protein [Chitinophaga sedimenti]